MSDVKILSLKAENVKKIEAVEISFNAAGLTTIGGGNGQGKTSALDSIIWALGGDRYKPSNYLHDGAEKVNIRIPLSNGVVVERTGKNGTLKVSGGDGKQSLLDTFYGALTLDMPKFMSATETEKTKLLLQAFPDLASRLQKLDEKIKDLYDQRTIIGRDQLQKQKYADELTCHEDAPEMPLSGSEMAERLKAALGVNAKNDEIRRNALRYKSQLDRKNEDCERAEKRIEELQALLDGAVEQKKELVLQASTAKAEYLEATSKALGLVDSDTSEIEAEMEQIDSINAKVRDNQNKLHAQEAAVKLGEDYKVISAEIEELRQKRIDLLHESSLPLEGLGIDEEGRLVFKGNRWDCMATSEQYRVAVALSASLKPTCKFVLLDRLEALDRKELASFDAWLKELGLQGIATRVSEGSECHVIIENGRSEVQAPAAKPKYNL